MRKLDVIIVVLTVIAIVVSVVCVKIIWDQIDDNKEKKIPSVTETAKAKIELEPTGKPKAGEDRERTYRDVVEQYIKDIPGDYQWGYIVFDGGEEYVSKAQSVPSASVIKVFIMEYAFDQAEKGALKMTDKLSGQTIETLIHAMITRSDNDATNTLIEKFGMENMNQFFLEQGYMHTEIQRKMLDTKAQKEGKDNVTSIRDVMMFLDRMYRKQKDEPRYSSMLEIMKQQEVRTKIPLRFPSDVVIANKTGELSNVENDMGILFGEKGDYAIAFLCSNLTDTASARNAIADAAYQFYLAVEK